MRESCNEQLGLYISWWGSCEGHFCGGCRSTEIARVKTPRKSKHALDVKRVSAFTVEKST